MERLSDELIEWEVYVPATYDPAKPAGLLVYVSPHKSGRIPSQWETLMAESNLIWVAASQSGNEVSPRRRIAYAMLATALIDREYRVAPERIYVSGFSGGGRVASFLSNQYPTVFSGAIYICGVNFWKEDLIKDLSRVLNNRYAFVTGTRDFNLNETRIVYRKYLKAGAENSLLEIENGMGHALPNVNTMATALEFLDRK